MKRQRLAVVLALMLLPMSATYAMGAFEKPQARATDTIVIEDEGGFADAISQIAKATMPAVVHVEISGTVTQQVSGSPFPFPFPFFGVPGQSQQREVPIQALGSGVIIDENGYVITNNHVVETADSIVVQFYDGSRQEAKLVGRDPATDLAVLKVNPFEGMRYASLGDSDALEIGQWVIAIGSPRGLDWTVTSGIVSATHRSGIGALGPSGYEDFIQTDAAINPGNSGGPLINLKGEVVGINSLILSASQGSEGLGFAIPASMVKTISDALIKDGKVVRGYLGLMIQDLNPQMVKSLKLPEGTTGVIIADVQAGGPADNAGLKQGDVLVKLNGKAIKDSSTFRNSVAATAPHTRLALSVLRDGKQQEITAETGDLSAKQSVAAQNAEAILGLTVEKVTPGIARNAGLRETTGVVVSEVQQGSVARRVGLTKGDIILRVGNTDVNDPEQFGSLVAEATSEGAQAIVMLVRDGASGQIGYLMIPMK
jgi:serine protease Do